MFGQDNYIEEVTIKTEDITSLDYLQQVESPSLIISEQPAASVRFRYPSEGNSHGGIPGVQSNEFRKTCPTVEIAGYKGYARIVVQLVTDDPDPKLHVHSLVGKQCDNGICSVTCGPGEMRSQFPNLGIQHVKKKRAEEILFARFKEEYANMSDKDLKNQAKAEVERMNLSAVRLMFIAYLPDQNNEFTEMLPYVISNPIVDNKSTLKICRISRVDSPATGGTEIFLLCDKVQKDDIQVRMFERDASQNEIWEDFCRFSPTDVHRQYAIVLKTPSYKNPNIDRPTRVFIQLRRKSDGQFSQPLQFTYTPVIDAKDIPLKRKRTNCGMPTTQSQIASLGSVSQAPYRMQGRNGKPKVDHHVKPIDPSLLMKRFTPAMKRHTQQTASYQSMPQGTDVTQSMVTSSQNFQNYNNQPASNVNSAITTIPNVMSPQSFGSSQGSPSYLNMQNSPGYSSSSYSNPGSVGTYDSSQGSPFQQPQMSPQQQQQMSPMQQQQMSPLQMQQQVHSPTSSHLTTVNSIGNMSNLPCIPGMNVPKPDALKSALQQNSSAQVSSQQAFPQSPGFGNVYTSMQNVQSNTSGQYASTYSQQEVDRQAFGPDYASVLDQLDFDDSNGDLPSIGSQFVENLLNEGVMSSIAMNPSRIPIVQSDSTAEDPNAPADTVEDSEDFTTAMQETQEEEQPEEHPIDDTFIKQLLETMMRKITKQLSDFKKSGNVEALSSAKQFFTKVHDRNDSTCLHLAALNGHNDILMKLAQYARLVEPSGSLLNVCNYAQQTPLQICILKGDAEIVKSLLRSGSDPNVVDGNGDTGLHLACEMGRADIVTILLSAGGYGEELYNYKGLTPLHILAQRKSEKSVECLKALLCHEGVDVNERELRSGQTALHMSVEEGNTMFAAYLVLKGGADIDAMTFDGLTPLHIASAHGNSALVQLLLDLGADKDTCICEESGSSVLSVAANEEIRRILQQPADAMSPDIKKRANQLIDSGLVNFLEFDTSAEKLAAMMKTMAV